MAHLDTGQECTGEAESFISDLVKWSMHIKHVVCSQKLHKSVLYFVLKIRSITGVEVYASFYEILLFNIE